MKQIKILSSIQSMMHNDLQINLEYQFSTKTLLMNWTEKNCSVLNKLTQFI